ncbi:MAG: hypothetical protein IJX63_11825 [Lachnospiraceae bacterium]|nr:hypothetical protein [Lachnospiraceae bacterium]
MNALLVKIGQLAVFLICAQTLVHFRPKDSYEKYIKLLVSMMLLILLVEPVMDLLGKGDKGAFLDRIHVYEQELQDILISPQLETEQIEVILQNITRQRVEEGTVYVQEKSKEQQESEQEGENVEVTAIQVEVEEVQEVRIEERNGKSADNY